jgi:hypothetical protein
VTCLTHRAIRFFIRDDNSLWPFFLTERFPVPQESQQGLLIRERRVQLWQRNDSAIAISRFHEQAVREPLTLHRFSKSDTRLFQDALERYPSKFTGPDECSDAVIFNVRQGFEVSAAQNHLFPGISLNGQLLTL